ncbi:MAG: Lrp/AsnC family transcriptional regulator [Terriglobales bacterium]
MNSEINESIDEISRKILRELQKDARISFAELGRQVGLSPSATAERVRRLEDEGIIRGYRVDIDPRALGYRVMVFTRMVCDGEKYKQFLAFIKTVDAIRECYHITGSDALTMKILAYSIEELDGIVMKFLAYGTPTSSVAIANVLVRTEYDLNPQKPPKASGVRQETVRLG